MKRRSSPIGPIDSPTNRSRWKCHAPLSCMPSFQKPVNSPNFICKRLRRAFKWFLQSSGSSGYSWG